MKGGDAMLPISQFIEKLEREGAAVKTLAFYRNPIEKFSAFCSKPIHEVTADDVYRFAKTIPNDYSRHNNVRAVNFFLKHSGSNVKAKLPSFTPPSPDENTPDQLKQLFSVATEDERRLFMFYLQTGCREGEVSHAVWENLTDSQYTVRPVEGWQPKKFKTRSVPVSDGLSALLEPVRKSGLMFPNKWGRPDGHHLMRLQRLAKRSGQDPALFCLQRLRRTYATTLLRTGATVSEVAGFLGHANLQTIMRYLALANCKSERIRGLTNSAFGGL
jgi:integrase